MADPSPLVAAITAVPPTIAAVGALLYARLAKSEAAGANAATNHQGPDEPKLVDRTAGIDRKVTGLVDELRTVSADVSELHRGVASCATEIGAVSQKLDRHLAFHQEEREQGR